MSDKDFMEVRVNVKNAEIVDKLDILRLERGISSYSFIISAIAEKLRRDGYLQCGVQKHKRKEVKNEPTSDDRLRSLILGLPLRK